MDFLEWPKLHWHHLASIVLCRLHHHHGISEMMQLGLRDVGWLALIPLRCGDLFGELQGSSSIFAVSASPSHFSTVSVYQIYQSQVAFVSNEISLQKHKVQCFQLEDVYHGMYKLIKNVMMKEWHWAGHCTKSWCCWYYPLWHRTKLCARKSGLETDSQCCST